MVIELLLVSTIPVMLQAQRGHVDIGLILITVVGGWMGAASANSLNMVADADIDQKMKRTQKRPLARKAVPIRNVLIFGIVLAFASFAVLYYGTADADGNRSFLPSILVWITIAFYVFVYTLILKRRTWQNVIWGGAAGCMPALVGWAAVTGSLSWEPFVMFLVVFFWTPPHTWALAMRYREDYRAAGVPMLPVIASDEKVTFQMLVYTVLTVITSLFLVRAAGPAGSYAGRRRRVRRLVHRGGSTQSVHPDPSGCRAEAAEDLPGLQRVPGAAVLRSRGGRRHRPPDDRKLLLLAASGTNMLDG